MPPDVHCPTAPICMWQATLAASDEQAIRADERRLLFREVFAMARDLEWSSRRLLELVGDDDSDLGDIQARVGDMRRIAGRVVRALDDAAERNAA